MIRKLIRGALAILGIMIGYFASKGILEIKGVSQIESISQNLSLSITIIFSVSVICGLILYFISPLLIKNLFKLMDYLDKYTKKVSLIDIVLATIGGLVGLLVGVLLGSLFGNIAKWLSIIFAILSLALALICGDIAVKRKDEIVLFFQNINKRSSTKEKKSKKDSSKVIGVPKVLDTSVIIDGRIFDICKTGFVEGPLVIPQFVLNELRHISDSSDDLKRTRGRRGLDILNRIQKELPIEVIITDKDFQDIQEVDSKLLKLAQVMEGKVVTNDFNLNKVAEFQGVPVLNINDLANAIKQVLIPGEDMKIQIIKEGKENNQGVAYLDDGTMIVVENGKRFIGDFIEVEVTSVLQTSAGRMIFASKK